MFKLLENKLKSENGFNASQIEELLSCFQSLTTEKHQILLHKGETARHLGCLRVFCIQPDGKESTRFFAFEGRFGTAFPSFILQQPSVALIDTVDKSELLRINYHDFQTLLATVPGWETLYRKELERDYVESILRIESFVTMNAAERYQRILQHEPHLIHRLPNRIVAIYMGISQETLSRLKSDRRF
ncbi:Crp/Fnr family transcriptional regulator [Fulvivirga ulvae]|uniref:Crp/Fnr family transcriptional regulator n=1 Tax=Fulvivirga ulvae TaxID=2904245 RepID=UPI001F20800A|nr:Crp/Fnr family transcriptional regulator [Fulvivirga ulvae]UII33906.1 Crp/Fnr family transcriptional regulator [Fulvivirga ulvae]